MSRSKYAGAGYNAIRQITELPIRSRRPLAIGRGGERRKPRKFHLNVAEIDQHRTEYRDTGAIPNPFNRGAYHFTLAALIALGKDQKHKWSTFTKTFRELMSDPSTKDEDGNTLWERFRDKSPKGSDETSLDVNDRMLQNVRVLQRFGGMTPYGLKLHEVGTRVCRFKGLVIDLLKSGTGEVYVRLNTEASRPTNELKTRNVQPTRPVRRVKRKARTASATAPAVDATSAEPATATA